jgi:aminoglycoside phosphotransferase (APT) family kinase protein
MSRPPDLEAKLAEVLREPLSEPVRRLSSGASRETFAFATASHGELVVQIERHRGASTAGPDQAGLLAAAELAGVPVPRVVAHGHADAVLGGSWVIVQSIPGTTDPSRILAGEGAAAAPRLIDGIAAALAAVHRIAPDPALAPPVEDPLAAIRRLHRELGEPHPTFELAFRVLEAGPPASPRRALVHGDYRIGNLMIGPDGVTGVLDWELAHIGDPAEDLGWLCVPAWRFSRPDRPAAGLGTREDLLEAYERHSGVAVDPDALRWWELAGTLRWGVICVRQAFVHLSGATRSVEHAVIGRRACEVEWDLLEMLDPGPATPEERAMGAAELQAPAPPPRLHDRPTAQELVEATRGALGDDVLPLLDGRPAFQVRVALRALGMVARELEMAGEHRAVHAAALARLGYAGESELAAAIAEGELDGSEHELLSVLRAIVRAKLQVANPAHLERGKIEQRKEEP